MANTKTKGTTKSKYADVPEKVSPNDIIMVRNGFNGRLVYVSTKTGEKFVWDSLGDETEMEVKELRTAKNSQKKFFENNWFMFDDEYSWIIPYIGVTKYYDNAWPLDSLQGILSKSPSEIKKMCSNINDGQKRTLIYLVKELYTNGEIDSLKTIDALETGLGISLSEG